VPAGSDRYSSRGRKDLLMLNGGGWESTESWVGLLRDCKRREMQGPVLAVGDRAPGFGGVLREAFPAPGTSVPGAGECAFAATQIGAPGSGEDAGQDLERRGQTSHPALPPSVAFTLRSFPSPSPRSPMTSRNCWSATTYGPSTPSG
jgi:hypothetical protein